MLDNDDKRTIHDLKGAVATLSAKVEALTETLIKIEKKMPLRDEQQ